MKQRVTKIRLDEVSQHEGLIVFGIVSHDPDYKLSLKLNQKIGISLKHSDPISIHDELGNVHFFSRFTTSKTPTDDVVYTLMSNRSGSFFMLKKLKNVDYLLYIHNSDISDLELKISTILRATENIDAVFVIDIKTLNDKNISYLLGVKN
jgi:hypothetical protein